MKDTIEVVTSSVLAEQEQCDALVIFVVQTKASESAVFRAVDDKLAGSLSRLLAEEHFEGKTGETLLYHASKQIGASRVILSGLGKADGLNAEMFRRAAAAAASVARKAACARVAFSFPADSDAHSEGTVQAVVEGALLGTYRYLKYKTREEDIEPRKRIRKISVLTGKEAGVTRAISRARIYAKCTMFARDLVNEPANSLNPKALSDIAAEVAQENGLGFRVIEKAELQKLGAGAILGVGSGSDVAPRIIELSYQSGRKKPRKVALVGKGITFDSGGLSLKTAKYMESMKCDMAGAAAVLAAMSALPELEPSMDVMGILCAAENMPSGSAIRPGDVLKAMNGKTIEIVNTDAEGRLVLADGLAWAVRQKADEILDLATLTGACVIGLGPYIAGIMGNDDELIRRITAAGQEVGERIWQLPIPDEYDFMVKSEIADIKNLAQNSEAGAIQGALFLREFIGEAKWAHLDIAGPAWNDREFFHVPKNGTGFGVRTLLQFLTRQ